MKRKIAWSYGGGTQSIAIWLLVEQGALPMPDYIIMADTSREASRTWRYNDEHIFPRMRKAGANLYFASHDLAKVDLYSHKGKLLLPAFTGDGGKLDTYCSSEWKTLVVRRYLTQKLGIDARKEKIVMWLGMSVDEVERLKEANVGWIENHWPLCNMPVSGGYGIQKTRSDCQALILNTGLPPAPKSACWNCPHTDNPTWVDMKVNDPADFAKAVALDYEIRSKDRANSVYLHRSGVPLDQVDFSQPEEETLFGCESGFCWT